MIDTEPWRAVADGLELFLRVTPNAGTNRIESVESRDDGSVVLRVRVSAPPDKGKANKAVIALLAERISVAKSSISVKSGETARLKVLHIAGGPAELAQKIKNLFQSDA